jgi:hypothetical protein
MFTFFFTRAAVDKKRTKRGGRDRARGRKIAGKHDQLQRHE